MDLFSYVSQTIAIQQTFGIFSFICSCLCDERLCFNIAHCLSWQTCNSWWPSGSCWGWLSVTYTLNLCQRSVATILNSHLQMSFADVHLPMKFHPNLFNGSRDYLLTVLTLTVWLIKYVVQWIVDVWRWLSATTTLSYSSMSVHLQTFLKIKEMVWPKCLGSG